MEIKSGKYKILDTGTVITFGDSPIQLEFGGMPPDDKLNLIISFKGEGVERKIETELHGSKELEIKLIGFNSGLDEGNLDPINIGTLNNLTIFLSFRTSRLSESKSRVLHFTIYQEEK